MSARDSQANDDREWSSSGLARRDAIDQWRSWAASTIAPIEVTLFDPDAFSARWVSHGIGQLRLLHLHAPAQRVTHTGAEGAAMRATPSIQLVYAIEGTMKTLMGGRRFALEAGQFVLLDNTRFYQMEMETEHRALDLMMPQGWLEKYLPDVGEHLARPIDGRSGWGAPLGALLETLAEQLKSSTLPRSLIAEQIGNLLALATGVHEGGETSGPATRHRGRLTRQILRRIENDYADPELTPDRVAADCGISKSYLQTLLAGSGTSFVQELNATRLERAADMLADQRAQGLSIGEVAYRSGFLDPGYFARLFRKRFGITPREWRAGHAPQS
ncbi:MAG: AraC family transcriptional regulator [Candidatus Andeanibacterium colombiense]|uniref:AraC family transcriptional regulator n=1 Tax=Candidatus Andeanibacterium colombiense TaxID=3121345 RepID=A0AAJ5XB38_9SPHN|nr:MAG: AraC family transcriptional regulator [Sphingomonadaceae bacterium]